MRLGDASKYEDKQCFQRDVTEVDVSRRGGDFQGPGFSFFFFS